MTYREVYKMVKRAQLYGRDYLTQATGHEYPTNMNAYRDAWNFITGHPIGRYSSIYGSNGRLDSLFTTSQLNNRLKSMDLFDNPYQSGTVPGEKLLQDMQRQANRKRNQYNATGRVTPSKQYRVGQRLPSGLIVTPDKVKRINQLLRQSASTNRPSSVYKPA